MNPEGERLAETCDHCGRGGLPVDHPWIAIDLDGTILEGGHYPDLGPPIHGALTGLMILRKIGFKIAVWTSRMSRTEIDGQFKNTMSTMLGIKTHLDKHGIPYDFIFPSEHKPVLFYKLIDDRAMEFKGDWERIVRDICKDLEKKGVPVYGDKTKFLKELVL